MPKLIMTKGLPASGKSTWAKEMVDKQGYKRINKDELRAMLDNGKWGKKNEDFVLLVRDLLIGSAIYRGFNIIVDDTNLHPKHEDHIKNLIQDKADFEIKDFTDVSLEECIKRDQKRSNYVGAKVIKDMYNQFLKPKPIIVEVNPGLDHAVICDLDGTLALFPGKNAYDRDFENDEVNKIVRDILEFYNMAGWKIILVSGRNGKFRAVTEGWLDKHINWCFKVESLFMRAEDDIRKDVVVKQEIYENNIKGKYNIDFVFDDRNQVVDFWRSQGLTCFQVAEGDF